MGLWRDAWGMARSHKPEGPQRQQKSAAAGSVDVPASTTPKRRHRSGGEESVDVTAVPESVAAKIGTRQDGVVTWHQLRTAGVGEGAIKHRANNGHLHRRHRGVYIVGHGALARTAKEQAALLACGDKAVIGHWSAAYLWGLIKAPPDQVHVTVIGAARRPRNGIMIRRTTCLSRQDIRRRQGLRLTSPARTIIDLAAHADLRTLERLTAEARVLKLLRDGELEKALARAGRRPGVARMRALLHHESGPVLTRSEAERRMRRLVQAAGLPIPVANARVGGYEVDFYWPGKRVIVEVDGYEFHGHRAAFERDRRKGLALTAGGDELIRISAGQLVYEPVWLAAHLAQALAKGS